MIWVPPSACAFRAEVAGEPLAGTAAEDGAVFFMVRFDGIWPPKAPIGSALPKALLERLADATKATGGRALLVRGDFQEAHAPELYVARTTGDRRILRMRFESYEAMADVDLEEVAARGEHPRAVRVDGPLFLVCTHGKRDACCAARGTEVFGAIVGMRPGRVFRTTHLGGHRFAAVTVSLPDGLCYGRVGPEEAKDWVEATERGRIFDLGRLRGRTSFKQPVQAAEVFLRAAIADTDIDGLRLVDATDAGERRHRVTFLSGDGTRHRLVVAEEALGPSRPTSCGAEPEPIRRFVLVEHRSEG